MNVTVDNTKPLTIRELEPGSHYIRAADLRRVGSERILTKVKISTADPFWSKTYFGSRVGSFPSDRVYRVHIEGSDSHAKDEEN